MGAKLGLAASGRDDHFPGMRIAWLPGERDDGAAVAVSWGEPDPGSPTSGARPVRPGGFDELARSAGELEAGFALADFQPGQGALGDPGRGGQLGQGDAPLGSRPLQAGTDSQGRADCWQFFMPSVHRRLPETATEIAKSWSLGEIFRWR